MSEEIVHPARYVVPGTGSSVVQLTGRICSLLENHLRIDDFRLRVRGNDRELDAQLIALHQVAVAWRTSETGTAHPPQPEVDVKLKKQWLSSSEAAAKLNITSRAVRQAIQKGRLKATRYEGHWRITREAVAHYAASR